MTSWTDYQDDISDAISDSVDVDWSASVGARAVVAWLNEHRPLSAAPAPEGGAVKGPGGYLVKDFADGWYWTPNAALDHASGAPVWSVADGRYETDLPALATREEAPAEAGEDDGLFLLMKRDLYYRPNAMGYTGIKDHAGRYTKAEAENHADPISGVTAIAAIDAPDFSPACFDDLARAHLVGKLERATRELSALRAPPVGWLRAVDEEMVCAHLGVADAEDSFETAKKKLASLIQWNIAVATDPSVGGHPAPDALRVAVEALTEIRDGMVAARRDISVDDWIEKADQALAALQAEQKGGAWWLT